jgi:hypothetical protein
MVCCVQALGKDTISADRLEPEMKRRETDKKTLSARLEILRQLINEEADYDLQREPVKQNLDE